MEIKQYSLKWPMGQWRSQKGNFKFSGTNENKKLRDTEKAVVRREIREISTHNSKNWI
jgi:hypothetical protein